MSFFGSLKREVAKVISDQERGAQRTMLEEIFHDLYAERWRIYKVNFVRGIFFGLGSALGGTVVVALIVWVLSFFVQLPLVGDYAKDAQNTFDTTQQ